MIMQYCTFDEFFCSARKKKREMNSGGEGGGGGRKGDVLLKHISQLENVLKSCREKQRFEIIIKFPWMQW